MRPHCRQLSALLVAFCLALVACGGGDDADEAGPQPTTTAPPTTLSQQQEDEQALRQLAEDWYEASDAIYMGEVGVEVARRFVGEEYFESYEARYDEFVAEGRIARPDPEGRSSNLIEHVAVTGDDGEVQQCVTDGDLIVDRESEAVLDDSLISTRLYTTAVRTPDGWRFLERSVVEEFPEEAACATE